MHRNQEGLAHRTPRSGTSARPGCSLPTAYPNGGGGKPTAGTTTTERGGELPPRTGVLRFLRPTPPSHWPPRLPRWAQRPSWHDAAATPRAGTPTTLPPPP